MGAPFTLTVALMSTNLQLLQFPLQAQALQLPGVNVNPTVSVPLQGWAIAVVESKSNKKERVERVLILSSISVLFFRIVFFIKIGKFI